MLAQVKGNLDINLLKTKQFEPNLECCRIFEDLIQPTTAMFSVQAENIDVHLKTLTGFPNGTQFMLDKMRIQQVLINLVQNAMEVSE